MSVKVQTKYRESSSTPHHYYQPINPDISWVSVCLMISVMRSNMVWTCLTVYSLRDLEDMVLLFLTMARSKSEMPATAMIIAHSPHDVPVEHVAPIHAPTSTTSSEKKKCSAAYSSDFTISSIYTGCWRIGSRRC